MASLSPPPHRQHGGGDRGSTPVAACTTTEVACDTRQPLLFPSPSTVGGLAGQARRAVVWASSSARLREAAGRSDLGGLGRRRTTSTAAARRARRRPRRRRVHGGTATARPRRPQRLRRPGPRRRRAEQAVRCHGLRCGLRRRRSPQVRPLRGYDRYIQSFYLVPSSSSHDMLFLQRKASYPG